MFNFLAWIVVCAFCLLGIAYALVSLWIMRTGWANYDRRNK